MVRDDAGGATPPVFLWDDAPVTPVGATVELLGAEGKHALVQRLAPGERVDVVDGQGLRLACTVTDQIPGGLRLGVFSSTQEPIPMPRITLVQALAKSDRDELAISTAVEVGVYAILPWRADRSIVVWRGDRATKAHSRWVEAVRAATKQARRAWLPPVAHVVSSKQLAIRIASVVEQGGAAWVLEAAGTTTAATAALTNRAQANKAQANAAQANKAQAAEQELLIIVGPEGGISPTELAAFQAAGAELVRLGPHIMRTSTAGPIAVARAAERLGRWEG